MVNSTNGASTLTIPSLPPNTNISSISVSAYTSIGRGESVLHDDVVTPAVPIIYVGEEGEGLAVCGSTPLVVDTGRKQTLVYGEL